MWLGVHLHASRGQKSQRRKTGKNILWQRTDSRNWGSKDDWESRQEQVVLTYNISLFYFLFSSYRHQLLLKIYNSIQEAYCLWVFWSYSCHVAWPWSYSPFCSCYIFSVHSTQRVCPWTERIQAIVHKSLQTFVIHCCPYWQQSNFSDKLLFLFKHKMFFRSSYSRLVPTMQHILYVCGQDCLYCVQVFVACVSMHSFLCAWSQMAVLTDARC